MELLNYLRFRHVDIRIDALTHYYSFVSMLRCKRGMTEHADR